MKNLIKSILGISVIGFFTFCLLSKPIQKAVIEKVQSFSESDTDFDAEEFFYGDSVSTTIDETSNETVEIDGTTDKEKKYHSPEVVKYFNEITLGSEFGEGLSKPYKWTEDVKIYVCGQKPEYMMNELNDIVSDLNDIIKTINIKIVYNRSEANSIVYLGSKQGFYNLFPDVDKNHVEQSLGYVVTYHNESQIMVDMIETYGQTTFQRHILREEITQSLGFFNDSYEYPNSIFYDGISYDTEYADIDVELIDMLYNE